MSLKGALASTSVRTFPVLSDGPNRSRLLPDEMPGHRLRSSSLTAIRSPADAVAKYRETHSGIRKSASLLHSAYPYGWFIVVMCDRQTDLQDCRRELLVR
jgi:hypothetical protein